MINNFNLAPKLLCHVRFLYACPDFGPINIFANGKPIVQNCNFSEATKYLDLPPMQYKIEVFKVSDNNKPILEYDFEAIPTMTYTICLTCLSGKFQVIHLKDNFNKKKDDTSYLRFINLSPNAPLLNLSISENNPLFSNVEFCETTNYYPLTPNNYSFTIYNNKFSMFKKKIPNLNLLSGEQYTLFIIGLLNGKPSLGYLFLKDM